MSGSNKKRSNSKKQGKKKKKSLLRRCIKTALKIIFMMFLLGIVIGGGWFYKKYGATILEMKDEANRLVAQADNTTFSRNRASTVYDINGDVIDVFTAGGKTGYLSYEEIPKAAVDAMVATEDRSFYEHDGVDFKANIKAVYELIKNNGAVKRGGSTITQQLAKNIFLSNEITWQRKTEEIFIATALEEKYEKYEILEFYLNNIYFGNGYYGIEAASQGYFSCSAKELDLSQIAFLCAIPNSPTLYDPLVHMDNTLKRRDRVLEQMMNCGCISTNDYNVAINEHITLNVRQSTKNEVSDYITSYVRYCAIRAIMQSEGFEFKTEFDTQSQKDEYEREYENFYDVCKRYIYSKGYNIYTAIDMKKQVWLQAAVNNTLKEFKEKKEDGAYNMQASAVCIDNETGRVTAIVGGRTQKGIRYGINRAYQSYRQPGSSLKPLLVYTSAFEKGYTPDSIVEDVKTEDGPSNSVDYYAGEITIRTAIEQSTNTVAWRLYEELTPDVCLKHIVDMNFKKITYQDDYLAASLGGVTYGTSALEMASAYAALENDGIYRNPTCVIKVEDVYCNVLVDYESDKKVIYEENACRMMTDCMIGVLKNGTGAGNEIKGVTCAGKTGTTNDKKDGWFVGYSSYYTTAVWVGCDNPIAIENLHGSSYPLTIWKEFMTKAHKGKKNKEFEEYKIVVR